MAGSILLEKESRRRGKPDDDNYNVNVCMCVCVYTKNTFPLYFTPWTIPKVRLDENAKRAPASYTHTYTKQRKI